ncbi:MAG: DUF4832 domain-containing protein [Myxococcales bacterium]|nr:DUF4832 domain-containing protein [Myxococcales bacterium]
MDQAQQALRSSIEMIMRSRKTVWMVLWCALLLACPETLEPAPNPSPEQPTPQVQQPTEPKPTRPSSAEKTWTRPGDYDRPITAGNPLKGFLTSHQWTTPDQRVPHRLEFLYLPFDRIMPTAGAPDFDGVLEPYLEASAARHNHMILRFYLDYPGRAAALPGWLSDTVSCTPYEEYGGGCSPNYDDPRLQATLLEFIEAFGDRYDGDQRLGFIQLGLLGFWGEWHTYPHGEIFAPPAFQREVIAAFDTAFDATHLMLRYPIHDSPERAIGFHDDSFAYSTLGDVPWFFHTKLVEAGADERWREVPIGGEVYPELQSSLFTDDFVVDTYSQDFLRCIEETHASWMINHGVFRPDGGYEGRQLEGAQVAALAMGYEFAVNRIDFTASSLRDGLVDTTLRVVLSNTGVAPFYYPLALQLEDESGNRWELATDLQSLQPGRERTLELNRTNVPVHHLSETYSLRLESPILLGDQVIRFADRDTQGGTLAFQPDFGCTVDDENVAVGSPVNECICDVDGTFITPAGLPCP